MSTRTASINDPCRAGSRSEPMDEAAPRRLFDLLSADGQERVVVLKTRYEQLLALERDAFLQELGLVASRDVEAEAARLAGRGKLTTYKGKRLAAVQGRDVGYVTLQQTAVAAPDESPFQDPDDDDDEDGANMMVGAAMSDLALRRMLTDGLFGEKSVAIRPQRKSLYEKIGALEGEEEEAEKAARASQAHAAAAALHRKSLLAPKPTEAVGQPGDYVYRSNAYQALRLAHSFPGRINVPASNNNNTNNTSTTTTTTADPAQPTAPVNVTGIPVYEEELRRWFNALDNNGTGQLDCDEFLSFMRSLDRDYGVASEYTRLEEDGHRLASDGKLGFEAFAYLVMRFARA